jgi:hypothetical protein
VRGLEVQRSSYRLHVWVRGLEVQRSSYRLRVWVRGLEVQRSSYRLRWPEKSALESIKRVADGENFPFVKRTRKREQLPISRNLEIIASKSYFIILIGRGGNGPRQKKTIVIGYKKEDILC